MQLSQQRLQDQNTEPPGAGWYKFYYKPHFGTEMQTTTTKEDANQKCAWRSQRLSSLIYVYDQFDVKPPWCLHHLDLTCQLFQNHSCQHLIMQNSWVSPIWKSFKIGFIILVSSCKVPFSNHLFCLFMTRSQYSESWHKLHTLYVATPPFFNAQPALSDAKEPDSQGLVNDEVPHAGRFWFSFWHRDCIWPCPVGRGNGIHHLAKQVQ